MGRKASRRPGTARRRIISLATGIATLLFYAILVAGPAQAAVTCTFSSGLPAIVTVPLTGANVGPRAQPVTLSKTITIVEAREDRITCLGVRVSNRQPPHCQPVCRARHRSPGQYYSG